MRKISMTDNLYKLRKFVFKDFIKEGYRYITRDEYGKIYAFSHFPTRHERLWCLDKAFDDGYKLKDISLLSYIFTDIKWEDAEPFEIPYIDWDDVPVDTPVVYIKSNGKNRVMHFCKYDEGKDRVILYKDGRTSFTERGIIETYPERVTIYEQGEKR